MFLQATDHTLYPVREIMPRHEVMLAFACNTCEEGGAHVSLQRKNYGHVVVTGVHVSQHYPARESFSFFPTRHV
jgi:hypothetical protein